MRKVVKRRPSGGKPDSRPRGPSGGFDDFDGEVGGGDWDPFKDDNEPTQAAAAPAPAAASPALFVSSPAKLPAPTSSPAAESRHSQQRQAPAPAPSAGGEFDPFGEDSTPVAGTLFATSLPPP